MHQSFLLIVPNTPCLLKVVSYTEILDRSSGDPGTFDEDVSLRWLCVATIDVVDFFELVFGRSVEDGCLACTRQGGADGGSFVDLRAVKDSAA